MSVINQMLRDLDARQAGERERAGLPAQLRTLPPAKTARRGSWGLLAAGLATGAALAWLIGGHAPPRLIDPPPAGTAVPAPAAAPPAPSIPGPAAAPAAAPPAVFVRRPEPPVAAPAARETAQKAIPAGKPAAGPAAAPPAIEAAPEPSIDKRVKGALPRELAEAEYRKGVQAAGNGDAAGALQSLRHALELDPRFAGARQALLSVLAGGRQWAEVRQVATDGLALDPARSNWAVILARLQHDQGDGAAAVDTLERHAAHAAGDADYQGLFAYLLQKRQRHAEAARRYQAALALRPGEGRWWYGLGLALEAAGRGGEAREAYAKARDSGNLPADLLAALEQKLR